MAGHNYAPSTRARIADLILGMHVETTAGILLAANFTTGGTNTSLFNIYGRIAVMQLFVELTVAADANATQVAFYCTFTTPTIVLNLLGAKSAAITSLAAHGRIVYVAGAVASTTSVSDAAGFSDLDTAGRKSILGGEGTIGVIGMQASDATQATTIAATGHLFYVPMSPGAYANAAL